MTKILNENINISPLIQVNRNFAVNKLKISKINTKESSIEISGINIPIGSKYLNVVALNYKLIPK